MTIPAADPNDPAADPNDVFVAGIGLFPFGRLDRSIDEAVQRAVTDALDDACVPYADVDLAYYCHVYYQGAAPGQRILDEFGQTGIAILNLENACSSSTAGIWQAYAMIRSGQAQCALVVGSERVPQGPTETGAPGAGSYRHLVGDDNAAARYALRARRYMHKFGAPAEALAQVTVQARANAARNPRATVKKELTVDDVLDAAMVVDPLTKYQVCPNADGAAATVLMSRAMLERHREGATAMRPAIKIAGAGIGSTRHPGPDGMNPNSIQLAAQRAYADAALRPSDIDFAQVHDAATIGQLSALESTGLLEEGTSWKATINAETALDGRLPVNTDGGMLGLGHPLGASGLRMLFELVTQMRGEATDRQVARTETALLQTAGANGVSNVVLLSAVDNGAG